MKLTAMIIGYKIVRLGYEALLKGIRGEFDFGGKVDNRFELKLLSASPGLFFVLFGSIVIVWAIAANKPIAYADIQTITSQPASQIQPEP